LNKTKIGIIGLGNISGVYTNNLKKFSAINMLACASRGIKNAQSFAKKFNIERPYKNAQALINDNDIDIVLNLTPPLSHFEINKAALLAGKHVYTEKPLATTFSEAKELVDLADNMGLRIGSAPDTFFGSRIQSFKEIIDQDKIGEVSGFGVYVAYRGPQTFHPNPYFFFQKGAGPLLDIGPYYIIALLSLLGPVKSVSAMSNKPAEKRIAEAGPAKGITLDIEMDTHVVANLRFENGAVGTLIMSFDVWDSNLPRMEIYGSKGTLCMPEPDPVAGPNLFGGDVLLRTKDNYRWYNLERPKKMSEWKRVEIDRPFSSTRHDENSRGIGLVDMVYAMRNGKPHRASGEMALHGIEVMENILVSTKKNCFIDMTTTFDVPEPVSKNYLDELS
jgi:predicted dehydrogenase